MYCNKGVIFQVKKTITGQVQWNICIARIIFHIAKQEIELHTLKHMTELLSFVQDMLLCLTLISNHLLLHVSESWYFRHRFFLLEGVLVKHFQMKKECMQMNKPLSLSISHLSAFWAITFVKPCSNARPTFRSQKHMESSGASQCACHASCSCTSVHQYLGYAPLLVFRRNFFQANSRKRQNRTSDKINEFI